ncbi:hypothetical protein HDV57DRAFT_491847 [Trichoderma longibrachiatum]
MGRTGRCRARTYESPLHLQKRRRRARRQWTLQRAGRAAGHWLPDQSTCSSQAAIRRVYLHVPAEPSAATPGFLARPLSLCATSGRRGRGASTQLWARRSTQVDVSGGRERRMEQMDCTVSHALCLPVHTTSILRATAARNTGGSRRFSGARSRRDGAGVKFEGWNGREWRDGFLIMEGWMDGWMDMDWNGVDYQDGGIRGDDDGVTATRYQ